MSMDVFMKKIQAFQLVLVMVIMLCGFGITWGKMTTEIEQIQSEKTQVVQELIKIREEIVLLRIDTARTNQKLEDHLVIDKVD